MPREILFLSTCIMYVCIHVYIIHVLKNKILKGTLWGNRPINIEVPLQFQNVQNSADIINWSIMTYYVIEDHQIKNIVWSHKPISNKYALSCTPITTSFLDWYLSSTEKYE